MRRSDVGSKLRSVCDWTLWTSALFDSDRSIPDLVDNDAMSSAPAPAWIATVRAKSKKLKQKGVMIIMQLSMVLYNFGKDTKSWRVS